MPPQDKNPDENARASGEPPQEVSDFARAFSGKSDKPKLDDQAGGNSPSSYPGSLTQLLGGNAQPPSVAADKPAPSPPLSPPSTPAANSFTTAFDGVNAFTRDPADLTENSLTNKTSEPPRFDTHPALSSSFTRLFGSGEGILTPRGPEDAGNRPPRPQAPKPPNVVLPSFSQAHSRKAPPESGPFTEAFRSQTPSDPEEPKQGHSFTDQFEPSASWRMPPTMPSESPEPYSERQEASRPPVSQHGPPAPDGGFTRLIGAYKPDAAPLPAETQSPIPSARVPQRSLVDPDFPPPGSVPGRDATVIINPSRREPEFPASAGKSEYTRILDGSKFRPQVDPYGATGSPSAAGVSAAPPIPVPSLQSPAWSPTPSVPPHWTPPSVTPPALPQPPALALPALPQKPSTLGDQLISFLPLILTLSVVNFLGLLVVLIVLFATRR